MSNQSRISDWFPTWREITGYTDVPGYVQLPWLQRKRLDHAILWAGVWMGFWRAFFIVLIIVVLTLTTVLALGPDRLAARSPEMLSAAGRDTMACRGTKTTFAGVARLGMGAVSKRLAPPEDFKLVVVRHSAVIGE